MYLASKKKLMKKNALNFNLKLLNFLLAYSSSHIIFVSTVIMHHIYFKSTVLLLCIILFWCQLLVCTKLCGYQLQVCTILNWYHLLASKQHIHFMSTVTASKHHIYLMSTVSKYVLLTSNIIVHTTVTIDTKSIWCILTVDIK